MEAPWFEELFPQLQLVRGRQRTMGACHVVGAWPHDPCWPVSCSHAGRTAPCLERLGPEVPMRAG